MLSRTTVLQRSIGFALVGVAFTVPASVAAGADVPPPASPDIPTVATTPAQPQPTPDKAPAPKQVAPKQVAPKKAAPKKTATSKRETTPAKRVTPSDTGTTTRAAPATTPLHVSTPPAPTSQSGVASVAASEAALQAKAKAKAQARAQARAKAKARAKARAKAAARAKARTEAKAKAEARARAQAEAAAAARAQELAALNAVGRHDPREFPAGSARPRPTSTSPRPDLAVVALAFAAVGGVLLAVSLFETPIARVVGGRYPAVAVALKDRRAEMALGAVSLLAGVSILALLTRSVP